MAFSLFSRDRNDTQQVGIQTDQRKARRFFEHAKTVADASNFDYAIECYLNGLRHDPDNLEVHQALRDVALRRKVGGGKPAGWSERFKNAGTPLERMLQAEMLMSKDPLNPKHMRDMMRAAAELAEADPELKMPAVVVWAGELVVEFNTQQKRPNKQYFIDAKDLFAQVKAWTKAVEACRAALRLDMKNDKLLQDLKDLEAERAMFEGGYSDAEGAEQGGYRKFIRDEEKQRSLEQEERLERGITDQAEQAIQRRRAEVEEDPEDIDKLNKLIDLLIKRGTEESEREAAELLETAYEKTGQTRYKFRIGDLKMRQYVRQQRQLKAEVEKNPDDTDLRHKYDQLRKKRLEFELDEYRQRIKAYPTDMPLRFELGKRLYQAEQIDDAIGAFQQAKNDPKHRASAHQYLGSCYLHKGWFEEAIDTLRQGVESHPSDDDRVGKDLRYLLMEALEKNARQSEDPEQAREAQKIASHLLQTDIGYRDIQKRMDQIRELVNELEGK